MLSNMGNIGKSEQNLFAFSFGFQLAFGLAFWWDFPIHITIIFPQEDTTQILQQNRAVSHENETIWKFCVSIEWWNISNNTNAIKIFH